jgi:hypothetical protein
MSVHPFGIAYAFFGSLTRKIERVAWILSGGIKYLTCFMRNG